MKPFLTSGFVLASALIVSTSAFAQGSPAKTYWLGVRDGATLKFSVKLPADAAKLVLKATPAPGRGSDTTPRYKKLTHTINGQKVVVHLNEIGWDSNGPDSGGLTWTTDAGVGAEWLSLDTNDPLFEPFASALKGLATEFMSGWFTAKVVVVEGGAAPPSFRLNRDGSYGKPSPAATAEALLADLTGQDDLSDEDMGKVRLAFLALANAARTNPNYRRENKCTKILDLPSGLAPLQLDDDLTSAAQDQADYCAKVQQATHSQSDPEKADLGKRLAGLGVDGMAYEAAGGGSLGDCPKVWMTSNTHYRPWWNLDGQKVTKVGFGVRKSSNGTWYFVAVLA